MISDKSGHLWNCIGSQQTDAGHIYEFEPKKEYDCATPSLQQERRTAYKNCMKKYDEIFPAVERTALSLLFLDPNVSENELQSLKRSIGYPTSPTSFENAAGLLRQLGYGCTRGNNSLNVFLPDRAHLLSRWSALGLPNIDIIESTGIATNQEFTASFLDHDCVLSCDKEFIHDHTIHLLPTIAKIFNKGIDTYRAEKALLAGMIAIGSERINACRAQMEANSLMISIHHIRDPWDNDLSCEFTISKGPKSGFRIVSSEKLMDEEKIWDIFEASLSAVVDGITSHTEHTEILATIEKKGNDKTLKRYFNAMWQDPKSQWHHYLKNRFEFHGEILEFTWRYLNDPETLSP